MAGKGIEHEFSAGGQEHQDAPSVLFPDSQGSSDAVHVNIHEDDGKPAVAKCPEERFSTGKKDGLYLAVAASAKVMAEPCHFVQALLVIIH